MKMRKRRRECSEAGGYARAKILHERARVMDPTVFAGMKREQGLRPFVEPFAAWYDSDFQRWSPLVSR
jgi:hypothetical protein